MIGNVRQKSSQTRKRKKSFHLANDADIGESRCEEGEEELGKVNKSHAQ